jgi:murein DD-endopeptidase MepM/ murein hydrolase activator NlpD
MYNKAAEMLSVSHAKAMKSIEGMEAVRKLLEDREIARHEPNTHPRYRLASPIAIADIKRVSDTFGVSRYCDEGWYAHCGTDIACAVGTKIILPAKAKLTKIIHSNRGWGNRVYFVIKEGPYRDFKLAFCHLIDIPQDLKIGSILNAGAYIAMVGMTGNTTGPHLHFMIGNNLYFNGYHKSYDLTTTIGFHDPIGYFNFEGARWG